MPTASIAVEAALITPAVSIFIFQPDKLGIPISIFGTPYLPPKLIFLPDIKSIAAFHTVLSAFIGAKNKARTPSPIALKAPEIELHVKVSFINCHASPAAVFIASNLPLKSKVVSK